MHATEPRRPSGRSVWIVALLTVVLVAGCGSTTVTSTSGPSAAASPSADRTAASHAPSTTSPDPFLGLAVVTVSPDLRVRSQPRVADDSAKYEPLLPTGTELTVIGGPVVASGYIWYEVIPVDLNLAGGHTSGWVAAADKDGTPWIGRLTSAAAGARLAISSVARAPADPAKAKEAAASITAFGLDLYKRMLGDGTLDRTKGAVFSPTSIALALAMARAGAKGETATQMDAVLHTSGWDALGPGLNALDQALASHNATWTEQEYVYNAEGEGSQVTVPRELALRIANSAFAQQGWSLEQSYLDRLGSAFGAGIRLVDYIADYEAARRSINAWVSEGTKKRIPELVPEGVISDLTRLVLVNAIYLKANWAREFDPRSTGPVEFNRLDGSRVPVPTMRVEGEQDIPYARGTGWQATELRYRGAEWANQPLAMTLILPNDLPSFEGALTSSQLGRIAKALDDQRVHLKDEWRTLPEGWNDCGTYAYNVELFLPRFGVGTKASLKDVLGSLGMPVAFSPEAADFTGIHIPESVGERIHIAEVIHQANIDVDEKGTEAAAATAVMVDTGGCTGPMPAKTITLRLDRPFLFVLRDVATGAVLFMGRVVDPSVRS
jgi:serpin B